MEQYYITISLVKITPSDIVGNKLSGEFVIQDNEAKITIGIREDKEIEDEERLTFSVTGTNAFADVLITTDDNLSDLMVVLVMIHQLYSNNLDHQL